MSGPELYGRRKRRGWSQMKLATMLGVHVSTVHCWEVGTRQITEKMAKLIRFTLP
jgi:DNA-binding transcriptional regulator YiaG